MFKFLNDQYLRSLINNFIRRYHPFKIHQNRHEQVNKKQLSDVHNKVVHVQNITQTDGQKSTMFSSRCISHVFEFSGHSSARGFRPANLSNYKMIVCFLTLEK